MTNYHYPVTSSHSAPAGEEHLSPKRVLKWIQVCGAFVALFGAVLLIAYCIEIEYIPQFSLDTIGSLVLLLPFGGASVGLIVLFAWVLAAPGFVSRSMLPDSSEKDREWAFLSGVCFQSASTAVLLGIFWSFSAFPRLEHWRWILAAAAALLLALLSAITLKAWRGRQMGKRNVLKLAAANFILLVLSVSVAQMLWLLKRHALVEDINMVVLVWLFFCVFAALLPTLFPGGPFYGKGRWSIRAAFTAVGLLGLVFLERMPAAVMALTGFGNRDVVLHLKNSTSAMDKRLPGETADSLSKHVRLLLNVGPKLLVQSASADEAGKPAIEVPRDQIDFIEFLPPPQKAAPAPQAPPTPPPAVPPKPTGCCCCRS